MKSDKKRVAFIRHGREVVADAGFFNEFPLRKYDREKLNKIL